MAEWAAKRFWKAVATVEDGAFWAVELDGRRVSTPGRVAMLLPTEALAVDVASEWDAQTDVIDPRTMPFTRSANSAIDTIRPDVEAIIRHISDYAGTDLTCYRADTSEDLAARQAKAWDPILDWAAKETGIRLVPTEGVMPIDQDPRAIEVYSQSFAAFSEFELAGFYELVALSGSIVLGLAVARGHMTAQSAWDASRIDETWQAELWGHDSEAKSVAAKKQDSFLHAADFLLKARN